MKRSEQLESFQKQIDQPSAAQAPASYRGLPNRLLTAFEVAEFVGCHEETVRLARSVNLTTIRPHGINPFLNPVP